MTKRNDDNPFTDSEAETELEFIPSTDEADDSAKKEKDEKEIETISFEPIDSFEEIDTSRKDTDDQAEELEVLTFEPSDSFTSLKDADDKQVSKESAIPAVSGLEEEETVLELNFEPSADPVEESSVNMDAAGSSAPKEETALALEIETPSDPKEETALALEIEDSSSESPSPEQEALKSADDGTEELFGQEPVKDVPGAGGRGELDLDDADELLGMSFGSEFTSGPSQDEKQLPSLPPLPPLEEGASSTSDSPSSEINQDDEEEDGATVLNPSLDSGIPSSDDSDDEDGATVLNPSAQKVQDDEDGATVLNPAAGLMEGDDDEDGATVLNPNAGQESGDDDEDGATVLNPAAADGSDTGEVPATASPAASVTGKVHHDALPEGHMLMWYKIEKVLGQGGFGLTYKAHDTRLDNHVAIKEYLPTQLALRRPDHSIHPKAPDLEEQFVQGRERFLNEARTLAQFKHSSLVRVATFFEEFNTAYMAMEYEEGEDLGNILKRKKTLDEKELLAIMMPMLQGIQVLHHADFIHRDIKPDNIFIRVKDGTPVLLDFGSARRKGGTDGSMTAMLTPSYAPMEQYFEEANRQGPWTDIYSLGAVMYRCISGRKPVGAPQRSNAVMRNQPDPLVSAQEIGEGRYSPSLLKAIDLALAVVETDRPQNIEEWLHAVEVDSGNEEGELAFSLRDESKLVNPKARMAMMAATLLLVGGAGYALWSVSESQKPQTVMTREERQNREFDTLKLKAQQGDAKAMMQVGERLESGTGIKQNLTQAISWYKKAAELNIPNAQYRVGIAYKTGEGAPIDLETAAKWFRRAAEANNPQAQVELGLLLESSKDPKLKAEALTWFEKAAQKGVAQAQYKMGHAFQTGQGKKQSDTEALQWHLLAAEQDIAQSQYALANAFLLGKGTARDNVKSARYMLRAAEKGIADAQYRYGMFLNKGIGVEKDRNSAALWFFKAAEQGHMEGQFRAAIAYDKGEGIRRDSVQAFRWYSASATQGYLKAQLIVAMMYYVGQGVPKDYFQAAKWFQKAANQGSVEAQNRLGVMYLKGEGVARDKTLAYKWFLQAAKKGHAGAQDNLGSMFEKGQGGIAQSYKKANYWYSQAAKQNNVNAQRNLGWMYEEGRGVKKNLRMAAKLYALAAQQGDIKSQNNLGWMYEDGKGVPQNLIKAYAWYSQAAAQGDNKALRNLQLLSQDMSGSQIEAGQKLARQYTRVISKAKRGSASPTAPLENKSQ
ncbi:MAG: SEL1-like repeat protein [Magnetococcales bacterium]|nr:SEL1-like repeat protein [Magnetococcales bacterium]